MPLKTTAIVLAAACLMLSGCGANKQPSDKGAAVQSSDAVTQKGGAELWAENCSRCHNIRPPQSFSDAQWQALVHHMRLRANLTGPETRKITEFLQASH